MRQGATPVTSAQVVNAWLRASRRCLGWAADENVGDLIMGGKKPLHLPRRLEPLHDPIASSRRLVGILRSVIEAFVLLLDATHDLALGGRIAFRLSVISTRGARPCFVSSFHNRRLAAFLSRRLWTGTSRTVAESVLTARGDPQNRNLSRQHARGFRDVGRDGIHQRRRQTIIRLNAELSQPGPDRAHAFRPDT